MSQQNNANFIWSIADLLRGPYKPHQLGRLWKFQASEIDDWVRGGGAAVE